MSIITVYTEDFGDGRAVEERVTNFLGYRSRRGELLIKASQRYGIAEAKFFEVLEEKPHHWWATLWKAAEFIASFSKQPYASWRKREI
jgi:hypothetical protein